MVWHKADGAPGEFDRVKYKCLKESQQRVSRSAQSGWNASAQSQDETNGLLFRSCMEAAGWHYVDSQSIGENRNQGNQVKPAQENEVKEKKVVKTVEKSEPVVAKKEVVNVATPRNDAPSANSQFLVKGNVNLRKESSAKSEKVGALKKGEIVEVLNQKDGWFRIKTQKDVVGWCSKTFLVEENK